MSKEKVSAKTKEKPNPVTVEYDFGEATLKGLVSRFGEEVVFSRAKAALVIDLQALMRREIEGKEFSVEKLQKKVDEWKPSVVSTVRRSASERLEDTVEKMTPEQQAELLKKLQAKMSVGGAKPQAQAAKQAGAR